MSHYVHKKITPWQLAAKILRGIAKILRVWPLLLVLAFIVSPISPHMRWTYTYHDYGHYRVYHQCTYLGVDGFVNYMHGEDCPFITLIHRQ